MGNAFSKRYGWAVPILLALALAVFVSLFNGAYPMPAGLSAKILFYLLSHFHVVNSPFDLRELTVMRIIRPPRVLLAVLAGTGLGMAGTALQGMMRNPLVGPDIVGVTSGAAFGGIVAILLDYPPMGVLAMAFCGGLIAMIAPLDSPGWPAQETR